MQTIQPPAVQVADKGALRVIRLATILGILATAALLGVVSVTAGLGAAGWIAGLVTGSVATALLATARKRSDQPAIFPADWVTLTRMVLIAGVTGLVADSFGRPVSITALVTLSAVALALDAVDGQVARRTGTATPLGGRFDGEADAFLILVLSIAVSRDYGSWVLAIGAARYAFLLAGLLIPWLAAPLPPRYWGKVAAAVTGIVLTVAASGLINRITGMIAVAAALLLLAESFGRNVIWLYRTGADPRARLAVRFTIAALALALLWFTLLLPDRTYQFALGNFVRIPIELLVLVAVALFLPPWPRRIVAAIAGILFTVLLFAKFLNMGYYDLLNRAFNPVTDWSEIAQAKGVLQDSIGAKLTNVVAVVLVIGLGLLLVAITAAAIHLTAVAARHRRGTVRGLAALTAVWGLSAGLSLQLIPGTALASASETGLAVDQVHAVQAALADPRIFGQAIHSRDPEAAIPASDLLTGLRGKDVLIVFVESYGQVAVRGTSFSPGIDAVLRQQQGMLTRAGWSTKSAWAGSPTSGGVSWLAHSTLQSGLWVNSQQRYDELIASQRFTLSDAFNKAGWHTVLDDPEDTPWATATSFYHYAQVYNRSNVGYHGPSFSYSAMPDQYTYAEFQRLELTPGHQPVMAQIATTSSHTPWAPLPSMVPWNQVGNGSVFDSQRGTAADVARVWSNTNTVRQFFGQSIQYSMTALTSWVTELNDPNLVLILLGDEQPHSTISGPDPDNYVPLSIVTRAPSVLKQISSWHWQNGLLPDLSAPFEPMDAFRNQLLNTFSTVPAKAAPTR
ncbi:CDP-alcohol phosphatidyltransferase family protein [Trebonia kvetii]|uniref:CDP-alcohol phosphatidyltransferase family protein n=1 Tax=Trebonia kvetii TaxID=2480626 RepID=A0A6P2C534_9ACTN|nr:CDP-alcohol phosphatidyltransferase family protein [Trebonia kvetii]TVZ06280.1 CDP-alcohol phosphatidyltransferase family protein [Trebonia kvetii]